ncbi:sterol regulatory element-binding protein 2 [Engraulis encrasicolus]|uniref:sterol regulatory element-binding protein 2 n=1 Tax=Engraulis encrasicolus TaxID=184585 RepID=UPI002FCF641C
MDGGEYISSMENMDPTLAELGDEFTLGDIDEMLQFVSNQVGDFPDLFEDQMGTATPRPAPATATVPTAAVAPQTPQTAAFQASPAVVGPTTTTTTTTTLAAAPAPVAHVLPLTPPQTPVQTVTAVQTQMRTPPLLQPRPTHQQQHVQSIQAQQATMQQAMQVQTQALTMHTQSFPVQTQSFPMQTQPLAVHSQALPVNTHTQTVMITSAPNQSRFIQNHPVICHQSPTQGFQGENCVHVRVNDVFFSVCFVCSGKVVDRSSWWALSLSMSAVNLSESAQGKMPATQLAQIYVTAATALRTALGHHLSCLPGYLLNRAESVASQSDGKPIPDGLRWLFTPLARQFFLSCDWSVKPEGHEGVYKSKRDQADPIAQLHGCFCEKLLERAVHSLIQPHTNSDINKCRDDSGEFGSTLEFLQLLNSCTEESTSTSPSFPALANQNTTPVGDPVCRWWVLVLKAVVHWLQGDDAAVRSLLSEAERVPRALHTLDHPLPKAVQQLCKAVQVSLSPMKGEGMNACLAHCERSSAYLRASINVQLAQSATWLNKGVELLVCDLLLTLRTNLWQRGSSGSNGESGPSLGSQLAGFQRDLSSLRKLGQCYRQAQHKVFLHETTVRLMAGASPTRTHQLLEHSLRRRTHSSGHAADGECVLGERERAHAILLACRHLPLPLLTPPGHRARLLAEAKRTLERVGDRRSVQDCQQILLRLGGGTTMAVS